MALIVALALALGFALISGLLYLRMRGSADEVRQLNAELERRVAMRTAELQQANADLESFTYSVSHDLRSPLRSMQGFLKLAQRRHADQMGEEALGLVERAVQSSESMDRLIDALLKLSRASRRDLTMHEVDVHLLLAELVEELRARAVRGDSEGGPTPEIEISEDLPGCMADGSMLRQVFQNLIDNAVKFSADRTPPRVWVDGRREEGRVIYRVRDNGVGFDAKFKEEMFAVFRRLHSKSEFEGTGVGLALVARIIRRHGGEVTAACEPGEGATFEVSIPSGAPIRRAG